MHGYLPTLAFASSARPTIDSVATDLPIDVSSRLGRRLRELWHERSISELRITADLGIDRGLLNQIERGEKSISIHLIELIALRMDLCVSDLLQAL